MRWAAQQSRPWNQRERSERERQRRLTLYLLAAIVVLLAMIAPGLWAQMAV
jgi:hypothetical protein